MLGCKSTCLVLLGFLAIGIIACNDTRNGGVSFKSSRIINDKIWDIEKAGITYLEIGNGTEKDSITTETKVIHRLVISGVGCSTCFEDLVSVLNSFEGTQDKRMVCLVITNPDRNSAFQLKRMHDIRVPVFITDDERLKAIGAELGSAFIISEDSLKPVFNLKPIHEADDIVSYVLGDGS